METRVRKGEGHHPRHVVRIVYEDGGSLYALNTPVSTDDGIVGHVRCGGNVSSTSRGPRKDARPISLKELADPSVIGRKGEGICPRSSSRLEGDGPRSRAFQ